MSRALWISTLDNAGKFPDTSAKSGVSDCVPQLHASLFLQSLRVTKLKNQNNLKTCDWACWFDHLDYLRPSALLWFIVLAKLNPNRLRSYLTLSWPQSSQKVHTQDRTPSFGVWQLQHPTAQMTEDPHASQTNTCPWSGCLKCNSAKPAARSHGSQSFKVFCAYMFEIKWNYVPFPAVKSESRWQGFGIARQRSNNLPGNTWEP